MKRRVCIIMAALGLMACVGCSKEPIYSVSAVDAWIRNATGHEILIMRGDKKYILNPNSTLGVPASDWGWQRDAADTWWGWEYMGHPPTYLCDSVVMVVDDTIHICHKHILKDGVDTYYPATGNLLNHMTWDYMAYDEYETTIDRHDCYLRMYYVVTTITESSLKNE